MTLLEDIQNSSIDSNSSIGTLLRKCKLLAARLDNKSLENWLLWESNGYPENIDVPEYRIWPVEIKGHFAGPFGSGLRNAPIPNICLPENIRKLYVHYQCKQSISSIKTMLKESTSSTINISTGDLAVILGQKVYKGQNCIQSWGEFSTSILFELLNAVRNRILDFALAIWKEYPTAGEINIGNIKSIDSTKVTQIFNTTIYDGTANIAGFIDSFNDINIIVNNFSSLANCLAENGINNNDIENLKNVIDTEKLKKNSKSFGPKVSDWIAKMMRKAADGSWNIGIGTAGTLLANAISKYYGL